MSDLVADLMTTTLPALESLGKELATDFLSGMGEVLSDAPATAQAKVAELVREGFSLKRLAMTSQDVEEAREYSEGVEKVQRRLKTVLLAESIVAQEKTAALISDLFGRAVAALGEIAKGLLTTIASGIASGAIQGLTGGGGGFDPSSIFPNL